MFHPKFILSLTIILITQIGFSQETVLENESNITGEVPIERLFLYYSYEEIQELRSSYPLKFESLIYYYYHSFTLEQLPCENCIPYDDKTFDISKYERYRKKTEQVTINDPKRGIRVTLLPVNELTYQLPIHQFVND